MTSLLLLVRILLLISSLMLVVGAMRALAADLRARRAGHARPDGTDIAIGIGMLAVGVIGAVVSAHGLF